MMQHAPSGAYLPPGHTSYVPGDAFVAGGIDAVGNVAVEAVYVDTTGMLVDDYRDPQWPWGRCVVATGTVVGWDYMGQLVSEEAAGTGTIAFAGLLEYPDGTEWSNALGIPFAYADDATPAMVGGTITPPDPDADHRGILTLAGATDSDLIMLTYVANKAVLYGDPYNVMPQVNDIPYAITGTIDATGAVSIAIPPAVADEPTGITLTFADGTTVRANLGDTTLTHQMTPLWMSQYAPVTTDVNTLVAVGFDAPQAKTTYATLTGPVNTMSAPAPAPDPDPAPPTITAPPASFATHVEADAWLDNFATETGQAALDWEEATTLAEKHASAVTLYNEFTD